MNCFRSIAGIVILLTLAVAAKPQAVPGNTGPAASGLPVALRNVGFEPPLNGQIPLDLSFKDETSRDVRLGDYFGHKPVLLALVYYGCPMLCNQVEQGVVGSLKMLSFNAGRDFDVVFVSFDPRETADMAEQKKVSALSHYGRPDTAAGWHFLTGSKESIASITSAAKFRYNFNEQSGIFAHASGIMLLTPDGRISRYFYGVEYPSRDVRLGLIDASAGKIGTPIDHLLLYCFQYDPSTARYSATILGIIRLGGVLTILTLVTAFLIFRRRDLRPPSPKLHPPFNDRSEQGAH
jgi:protein SCO1/2